jgi:hypothetical protein
LNWYGNYRTRHWSTGRLRRQAGLTFYSNQLTSCNTDIQTISEGVKARRRRTANSLLSSTTHLANWSRIQDNEENNRDSDSSPTALESKGMIGWSSESDECQGDEGSINDESIFQPKNDEKLSASSGLRALAVAASEEVPPKPRILAEALEASKKAQQVPSASTFGGSSIPRLESPIILSAGTHYTPLIH